MRKIITYLLLALCFVAYSTPVLADKDKHHRDRIEHGKFSRVSKKRHDKHHDRDKDFKYKHKKHKDRYDDDRYYRHHKPKHYKHKDHYKHHSKHYSKKLKKMIKYACRGGRDIDVWEISPDVYVVRYYLNGHYYSQRLYPGSGRYGARGIVNVNWAPSPGWSLLPSININIPFD